MATNMTPAEHADYCERMAAANREDATFLRDREAITKALARAEQWDKDAMFWRREASA